MTPQPSNPLHPRNGHPHPAMAGREEYVARMEAEVAQLRRAVASHASVDQAIGVLICLHQVSPDTGFTVLRVASQLANTKLSTVAYAVTRWARTHEPLPTPIKEALDKAVRLHARTPER
ncbi:ANTAR domain-containing protein [Streptomyces sp. NPDC015139]|uniref:ANTAR domain-containing protein n=1 Tax=Streptomyces sp. NPDC015139 TaxID=3364942 RepID=UPI0036FCEDFD